MRYLNSEEDARVNKQLMRQYDTFMTLVIIEGKYVICYEKTYSTLSLYLDHKKYILNINLILQKILG
jgi:hypothetical protein